MIEFPEWSDLGNTSRMIMDHWERQASKRLEAWKYFSGDIFKEKVPTEYVPDGEDPPLLYPVAVNLTKMLCMAQADSLFGEWEERIISFEPRQDDEVITDDLNAQDLMRDIVISSNLNSVLWEVALDREVFGGAVIKIFSPRGDPGRVIWRRVPLDNFYCVWDPDDPDTILEAYILSRLTREQAYLKYGIRTTKDYLYREEKWTATEYHTKIDNKRIDKYSGANPWQVVPFVYIPRYRFGDWYGDSLAEQIKGPQDELNMRLADLGETINYNTHPTRYGINLPSDFNARNYPLGPNSFWDMGRSIGDRNKPEVGMLEAKNPIPNGVYEYINFLYDWTRTSAFAPPIAFGEDQGGGQRSGITLEIRMWPLVKATRRSRSYMDTGLVRAMKITGLMLKRKRLTPKRAIEKLIRGELTPVYAKLLPRDQGAIVDEVVKGLETTPPTISLETSVKKLGRGSAEVGRIKEMLEEDLYYKRGEKAPSGPDSGSGAEPKEA